jgi:hypothetical protein
MRYFERLFYVGPGSCGRIRRFDGQWIGYFVLVGMKATFPYVLFVGEWEWYGSLGWRVTAKTCFVSESSSIMYVCSMQMLHGNLHGAHSMVGEQSGQQCETTPSQ